MLNIKHTTIKRACHLWDFKMYHIAETWTFWSSRNNVPWISFLNCKYINLKWKSNNCIKLLTKQFYNSLLSNALFSLVWNLSLNKYFRWWIGNKKQVARVKCVDNSWLIKHSETICYFAKHISNCNVCYVLL